MKRSFSLLIALSASLTLLNLGLVYADDPPDEISETEYAQNNGGFSKYHDFSADEEQFGFTHVVGAYSYTDSGDKSYYEEDISNTRTAERNIKIGIHSLFQNDRTQSQYAGQIMKNFEKTGFGMERSALDWVTFEQQKGVYDFEEERKVEFEQTKDLNFDRMLILSGGSPFYTSVWGAMATTDSELKGWYDYCYNVVKQTLGRYKYYEVWNEPNLIPNFNPTGVDAKGYVELLKQGFKVINGNFERSYIDCEEFANPERTASYSCLEYPKCDCAENIIGAEVLAWQYGNPKNIFYLASYSPCVILLLDKMWDCSDVVYTDEYKRSLTRLILGFGTPKDYDMFEIFGSIMPPRLNDKPTYVTI